MLLRIIWLQQLDTTNMLYNLRYGGTISIPTEKFLDMSDEDLDKLELYYRGGEINDPFFGSVIVGKPKDEPEEELLGPPEEEPAAEEPDI